MAVIKDPVSIRNSKGWEKINPKIEKASPLKILV